VRVFADAENGQVERRAGGRRPRNSCHFCAKLD
jgi:hypothetical protein